MVHKCATCEFRNDVYKGLGCYPECTKTTRKQNGISLRIKSSPQWCPFKKVARRNKKKSPRAILVKQLDKLVRLVCIQRANATCEISGMQMFNDKGNCILHAHHVISRSNYRTRWMPENLVLLTPGKHTLNMWSAHKNPFWFAGRMLKIRGQEWVDMIMSEANQDAGVAKHTIEDLQEIKAKLEKELSNGREYN